MKDRLLVFIPTYNCEPQISRVLSKINQTVMPYIDEVLIIDNKSQDNTVQTAISASDHITKKITVLRNNENYNLGGSIKRAFIYAIENGYDYMVTLHGDDQADIHDFLPVFQSKAYQDYDMVIGARFHPNSVLHGYSFARTLGNRVLNSVCALINRRRVYDLIAGINCFKISFFKNKFFLNFPDNLTFDAHLLLYGFNKNAKIHYFPISWREDDQISNAKVLRQAATILRLFVRYCIQREKVFEHNLSGRAAGFKYPSEIIFQR